MTTADFKKFHSSVNRIPRLPELAQKEDPVNREIYTTGPALPLDHYSKADRLSGRFTIDLRAATPLIVGEQSTTGKLHEIAVQTIGDTPYIPSTMIKGMLARAYETVSVSHFRVFEPHQDRLTYRTSPQQSLSLKPVRVEGVENKDGRKTLTLKLLDKTLGFIPVKNRRLSGRGKDKNKIVVKVRVKKKISDFSLKNGQLVTFFAVKTKSRLVVTHLFDLSEDNRVSEIIEYDGSVPESGSYQGYVYITTDHAQLEKRKTNFGEKWSERIFVIPKTDHYLKAGHSVAEGYACILSSYQQLQEDRQKKSKSPVPVANVFARTGIDFPLPEVGTLAYAVTESDGTTVRELIPITVGRHAYSDSPQDLAERDKQLPAVSLTELSSTDRLFGAIPAGASSGSVQGVRGRIRVGQVSEFKGTIGYSGTNAVFLPPLLSPKPSSGRRFLVSREAVKSSLPSTRAAERRDGLFTDGYSLAEAAYPTHRDVLDSSLEGVIKKHDALRDTSKDSENVRLRVRSWIQQGSTFSCDVHFEDLTKKELAFLIWALKPENLVPLEEQSNSDDSAKPGSGTPIGYHKIGIGKPIGLGALEVRIREGSFQLIETSTLAEKYLCLKGCLGTGYTHVGYDSILGDAQIGDLSRHPWILAFQRSAFGFSDKVPVRYMSLNENRSNNQTDKHGNPKEKAGLSPEELWSSEPVSGTTIFSDHIGEAEHSKTQGKGKGSRHKKTGVSGRGERISHEHADHTGNRPHPTDGTADQHSRKGKRKVSGTGGSSHRKRRRNNRRSNRGPGSSAQS